MTRPLVAALTAAAILAVGVPAGAHPGGLPAVLQVSPHGNAVEVSWSAPSDDVAVAVEAAGGQERLGDYLLEHIAVLQDGRACPGSVTRLDDPASGADLRFTCPRSVEVVTLRADLLLDVDRAYQTLAVAPVRTGPERVLLGGGTVERQLHFAGEAPSTDGDGRDVETMQDVSRGLGLSLERRFVAFVDGGLRGWAVVAALGLALLVGAAHAMGPGHGKSVAAAYLVGERARVIDAVAVGVSVAAMHTVAVLGFGLATWWTTRNVEASAVVASVAVGAGLAVTALGIWMTVRRLRERRVTRTWDGTGRHGTGRHGPEHVHGPHDHSHTLPESVSPTSVSGIAIVAASGGLVPSPTALVVLLAAVSVGRIAVGLALVAAFSVGLAVAVTAVGLAVLWGRDRISGAERRLPRMRSFLPLVGSVAVIVAGIWLTARAALSP